MYMAIQDDEPDKLRDLLEKGGDVNAWMEDPVRISGKSLLHVCCEKGRYKCAEVCTWSVFTVIVYLHQDSKSSDRLLPLDQSATCTDEGY